MTETDVLVVGGGATGLGVTLVEMGDFSSATSGRYRGLLHSGAREREPLLVLPRGKVTIAGTTEVPTLDPCDRRIEAWETQAITGGEGRKGPTRARGAAASRSSTTLKATRSRAS